MTALRCCKVALWLWCAPALAQDPLDSDGDGVIDLLERKIDTDGDGLPDVTDPDDDGDLLLTRFEYFPDSDANDSDRDGTPDYLDADDDDDLILTIEEASDPNGDGNPKDARCTTVGLRDYLNADDDSDGVLTLRERPERVDLDTDGDHTPDHRDNDDDGDGRFTIEERGASAVDSDDDKLPDYLDPDDDDDTLLTVIECADFSRRDVDGDGLINSLDLDSDGDGIPDQVEGTDDRNGNGIPDYLDPKEDDTGQGNVLEPLVDGGRDGSVADASSRLDASRGHDGSLEELPPLASAPRKNDEGGCALGGDAHGGAWLLLALLRRRRRA